MERRIEVAGILKQYRMDNVDHKFCAEEQGAHQHFEVSAQSLHRANANYNAMYDV